MDVVLFEQHSGSSWIIKAVDWLFIQRAVEICEERVRRCCYSQGVPVADGQISAEFPGVLTEVFVSWHIRLHQTSSDFIRLLAVLQDIHWPLRPKCHWSLALQKKQASPQARETSIIIYW